MTGCSHLGGDDVDGTGRGSRAFRVVGRRVVAAEPHRRDLRSTEATPSVLMSEHSRGFSSAKWLEYVDACDEAGSERVTLVPGIEYGDEDDIVHIPVWGRVPFFGEAPHIGALLAEVSHG